MGAPRELTVFDLQRNDVDGAMEIYRRERAAGTLSPEISHMLLMLQDKPDELMDRMAEHDAASAKR